MLNQITNLAITLPVLCSFEPSTKSLVHQRDYRSPQNTSEKRNIRLQRDGSNEPTKTFQIPVDQSKISYAVPLLRSTYHSTISYHYLQHPAYTLVIPHITSRQVIKHGAMADGRCNTSSSISSTAAYCISLINNSSSLCEGTKAVLILNGPAPANRITKYLFDGSVYLLAKCMEYQSGRSASTYNKVERSV
ncbi:hypothetical protein NPIL_63411 [Nephila pilipes]|uniref:Uncharacterized protein n=1 Tax=Nephila pilipes TaxID=299642 RepID=A0A8X6MVY2_NEPPI|nr:hypothetical protein NPIL_63411 [Nephila pilipes]